MRSVHFAQGRFALPARYSTQPSASETVQIKLVARPTMITDSVADIPGGIMAIRGHPAAGAAIPAQRVGFLPDPPVRGRHDVLEPLGAHS